MADRLHALAFNELSKALRDVDRFVPLSDRDEIARRLVPLVLREAADEAAQVELLAHHFTARWLRDRADRIEHDAVAKSAPEREDMAMPEITSSRFGGGGQEGCAKPKDADRG